MATTVSNLLGSDSRFDLPAIAEKKRLIADKIRLDEEHISLVREGLKKSTELSNAMMELLNSFEHRLVSLESSIRPVHDETQSLTCAQENIGTTVRIFDVALQHFNVPTQAAPVLSAGPSENLPKFLNAMQKIQIALQFFNKESPKGSENIVLLLKSQQESGFVALESEFRRLVSLHSKKSAQKQSIDDLVSDDFSLADLTASLMPEADVVALGTVAQWLNDAGRASVFSSHYAECRSHYIVEVLQLLTATQMMFASVSGSTAGVKPVSLQRSSANSLARDESSASTTSQDSSTAQASSAVDSMMLRRATAAAALHRRTGSSVGLSIGKDKKSAEIDSSGMGYEKGSHPFLDTITVFLRQMKAERVLATRIIPASHFDATYSNLCKNPLENILSSTEGIVSKAKRQLSRNEFGVIFELLNILELLQTSSKEFQGALEGGDAGNVMSETTSLLSSTLTKALTEYEDSVKNDSTSKSKLSMDGTVHVLTRNTVAYLLKLFQYQSTIESLLSAGSNSPQAFISYLNRVVSQLTKAIEHKAEAYESHILGTIFKLNNFHYVLKTIRKSDYLQLFGSEFESSLSELVHGCLYDYQGSWKKALEYILEVNRNQAKGAKSGKLSKSERTAIKDKFKGFNSEFDEVYKSQKTYSIPDPELRAQLRKDNVTLIIPLYRKFLERYQDEPFTKNIQKYLKFSAETLEGMLNKFFDVSA